MRVFKKNRITVVSTGTSRVHNDMLLRVIYCRITVVTLPTTVLNIVIGLRYFARGGHRRDIICRYKITYVTLL